MIAKFIYFFLPIIVLSFFDLSYTKSKWTKYIYWILCFYVLIFSYTAIEYSGDYINYRDSFNNVNSLDEYLSGSVIKGYAFEPGFLFLCLFVKSVITSNGDYGVFLITMIAGFGLLYFLPRYTSCVFIALMLYIAHFYWWIGIVLLRQMYAMVILFPLIGFLKEDKYKKSIFLIAFASFFHASALIFYFFLVARFFKLFKSNYRTCLLIIVAFLLGYVDVFKILLNLILGFIPRGDVLMTTYMQAGSDRPMNVLAYVEMLVILFFAMKYRLKIDLNNKYVDIAIDYLIWSIVLTGLFYHYEIGSRFALYFNFYSYLILLPVFITVFKYNLLNRFLFVSFYSVYFTIFLIRFVYITI